MLIRIKKAQSTLEYALLISVVVGAMLTMQSYLKRSLQGKLKDTGDQIGDQYSPGLTLGEYTTNTSSNTNESIGDQYTTTTTGDQQTTICQEIKPLDQESWPANWQQDY